MNTEHMPGPWIATPVMAGYAINGYRIYAGDDLLARTHAVDEGFDEANACLISAAPDLLEACGEAIEAIADGDTQSAINALRAAIAKALGETR